MKYEKEKHGMARTKIYNAWCNMKGRCYRKSMKRYELYGGRGIKVCDEWLNSFISFYNWSMKNGYQENLTLDRIDVNGNYSPKNCRWISNLEQQSNKTNNHYITYEGKTKSLIQWAKHFKINEKTLQKRLSKGWSIKEALTTPINKVNKK